MPSKNRVFTPDQKAANKERGNRWREKNKEKVLAQKRKHYAENKDKYYTIERDRQYRLRYGITLDDFNRMLASQDGKCKICESDKAGNVGQCFAVDHCHTTGRVRGLLCIKCNARLGWLERHLNAALNYLQEA